jgi:hypothetical protein
MDHSALNNRAATPPVSTKSGRGGARDHCGKRSLQRRQSNSAASAGGAAFAANTQERKRLADDIAALANPQGRSLTTNELRIILRISMHLQLHDGYTEYNAIEAASVWAGSAHATIAAAYKHWLDTHTLLETPTSRRGSGNAMHPRHDTALSMQQICAVHALLTDAKLRNEFVPARVVQERVGLQLSLRQTQRILKQLGYTWGRKRCIGYASRQQQQQRTRSFIRQYANALQQQCDDEAVIIYTDESYIHTTHSNQYCWYSKSSTTRNDVCGTASKGKRLILLHAMSMHGLLHASGTDGGSAPSSNVVSTQQLTCELIFEGLIDSEDYHKNMDSIVYMQWIHNRLIPTFKHCFPGKKCILVLDNAAYHHPRGEDWINPNKMNKLQLAAWISEHADSITVQRNGLSKYFGKAALFQPASRYAPTVIEMRSWIKQYLQRHPSMNRTLLRKAFDAEGWQLIYTAPYQCESQPIEMVWAYVKNYVGRHVSNVHTVNHAAALTRLGFYGDEASNHAPIDASLCKQLIDHVQTWCNAFIATDIELSGDIDHLAEIFVPADDPYDDIDIAEDENALLESPNEFSDDDQSDDAT